MKKKKWLIITAVVLIILVVPFSSQIYKDGGTRTYTSLIYKIVDFNRLTEGGEVYSETKIFPFPMNFMSDDFLMASANGVSVSKRGELPGGTYENTNGEVAGSEDRSSEEDIPATPPALNIIYDGEKGVSVDAGTFCWIFDDGSGNPTGLCADDLHPLESKEYMKKFTASSGKIKVIFPIEPDSVTVRCWPESAYGEKDTNSEKIEICNGEFSLKRGEYIYFVTGVWNSGKLKGSDVSYSFCVKLN